VVQHAAGAMHRIHLVVAQQIEQLLWSDVKSQQAVTTVVNIGKICYKTQQGVASKGAH
jgi:hypothetical protein